jgi:muramidase (phage lysozyme)
MLAVSEIGPALLTISDNGYNVLVGSTPAKPLLFTSYADHPNVYNKVANSTAAGRYQLLHRFWQPYRDLLVLPDFSPDSQDAVALQQIKERHAIDDIEAGMVANAISKCANIWASLPGAQYGQHENKLSVLLAAFVNAGGTLS